MMRPALPLVLSFAVLLSACASDKKVPPPPQGVMVDVSQPADLSRDRELLDGIPQKQGYAKKVDAYLSPEGCGSVAAFYGKFMSDTHWTELPIPDGLPAANSTLNQGGFRQSWKYMSRHLYIVGSPARTGAGCVVMTAIYDKAHRNRYESQ